MMVGMEKVLRRRQRLRMVVDLMMVRMVRMVRDPPPAAAAGEPVKVAGDDDGDHGAADRHRVHVALGALHPPRLPAVARRVLIIQAPILILMCNA